MEHCYSDKRCKDKKRYSYKGLQSVLNKIRPCSPLLLILDGFTVKQAAERFDCSARKIARLAESIGVTPNIIRKIGLTELAKKHSLKELQKITGIRSVAAIARYY